VAGYSYREDDDVLALIGTLRNTRYIQRMRILVTGATGFVGSNLVKAIARTHEIVAVGRRAEQSPAHIPIMHYGDLLNIPWKNVGHIDALLHQAAITDTSVRDRDFMMRVNLESSKILFQEAARRGCTRIVFASSTAVYGNTSSPLREDGPLDPLNPYAESKVLLEEYAKEFVIEHPSVCVVALRYCNVYGPGESHKGPMASMIYKLARQMQTGDPTLFAYGSQRRDYIYVDDVVRANVAALDAEESCVVNCATGASPTFNEVVDVLNDELGLARTPVYIENPHPDSYQSDIRCDVSRARELLGFTAEYDLARGIREYHASGLLTS
jgi:ADP-L-glycero-D-manno-heptose 6-epimerase